MHSAINFIHSENGSISHILIPTSTVLLSSRLFKDAKLVTVSLRITRTSFVNIFQCFRTQSPASTFLHIRYTWIAELMWVTMIKIIATFFVSRHHRHWKMRAINATLDKRSWAFRMLYPPHFFIFYLYISKKCFVHPLVSGSSLWIHQYSVHIIGRGFCGADRL